MRRHIPEIWLAAGSFQQERFLGSDLDRSCVNGSADQFESARDECFAIGTICGGPCVRVG
jgi:hypothetical protein